MSADIDEKYFFTGSFDYGKRRENAFFEKISQCFPLAKHLEGYNVSGDIDVIDFLIEVKSETAKTGRALIELNECVNHNRNDMRLYEKKPAGLSATLSKFYIHIDGGGYVHVIFVDELRKYVADNDYRGNHITSAHQYQFNVRLNQGSYCTFVDNILIQYSQLKNLSCWFGAYDDFTSDVIKTYIK